TYSLLLFSVCVAPLVLMRSDKSTTLGVKWFETWEKADAEYFSRTSRHKQILALAICLLVLASLSILCLAVTSWYLATLAIPVHPITRFAIGVAVGVAALFTAITGLIVPYVSLKIELSLDQYKLLLKVWIGLSAAILVAVAKNVGWVSGIEISAGALLLITLV